MVDACKQRGINRMVLVSSILANGAAVGQIFNPAYIVLNIFGLTLIAKHQAEKHLRKSGIDYTIIRPGGLKNEPPSGNILLAKEVNERFCEFGSYHSEIHEVLDPLVFLL
jgi:hypothetical protein